MSIVGWITTAVGLASVAWGLSGGEIEVDDRNRRAVRQGAVMVAIGLGVFLLAWQRGGAPYVGPLPATWFACFGPVLAALVVARLSDDAVDLAGSARRDRGAPQGRAMTRLEQAREEARAERAWQRQRSDASK